ncbi:alpha/beta fold hydrolase [Salibacterium salarium]|uniref:alpha/beta fold hydrolase n=1 Tax=Salibacterium salarium TaxID=284579 RepID=UPI0027D7FD21|nr:alpha/beta fold hydrolase [Salibacterium salarium]
MQKNFIQHRKKLLLFLSIFVGFFVAIFFIDDKPTDSMDTENITPTLFIHGFKGGSGSFHSLLNRFDYHDWGSKGLTFYVSASGNLQMEGSMSDGENPFIQIIFENNRASLDHQTLWVQKIMTTLRETYDIKQVNLVGHSMGGLTATNFLLHNQTGNYPEVNKLVVMGSPFQGIDDENYFSTNYGEATKDLKPESESLRSMIQNNGNFNENIDVLAVAGVINNKNSDGVVHVSSALGIQDIVPSAIYNEAIIKDVYATHSGLHEHPVVDQKIAHFLWDIKEPS